MFDKKYASLEAITAKSFKLNIHSRIKSIQNVKRERVIQV